MKELGHINNLQLNKLFVNSTFDEAVKDGKIVSGDNILLVYSNIHIFDLSEVCIKLLLLGITPIVVINKKYNILMEHLIYITPEIKKLKCKIELIDTLEYMKEGIKNMKDKITLAVCNPPYDGKARLHQQIFNKTFEILEDSGVMVIIQPAYTYQNNKSNTDKYTSKMSKYLEQYKTSAELVHGSVFKDALIATDLSITRIEKVKSTGKGIDNIESFTYKNGDTYENIPLSSICFNTTPPALFTQLRTKYEKMCSDNGSIADISFKNGNIKADKNYAKMAKIRGHIIDGGIADDFYSIFAKKNMEDDEITFGLECKKSETKNVYRYLASNTARYGFSMLKMNNNVVSEIALIPIIDFSKEYTEVELYSMFGFTDEEIAEIERIIPYWDHGV